MCILTNYSKDICQPYPLYPVWMSDENTDVMRQFFEGLRQVWSDEKVDEWYNAIYGDVSGPEKPENLVLLSPDAYLLFTKGYIAFEPVDKDPEGMWLSLKLWCCSEMKKTMWTLVLSRTSHQISTHMSTVLLYMMSAMIVHSSPVRQSLLIHMIRKIIPSRIHGSLKCSGS